jgi:hypothetical protein
VVCRGNHLRLRRDWSGEAEDEAEAKQNLFHVLIDADSPHRSTSNPAQMAYIDASCLYFCCWFCFWS